MSIISGPVPFNQTALRIESGLLETRGVALVVNPTPALKVTQ
jgi:hypothetical protein